jgi:hypothetical protein
MIQAMQDTPFCDSKVFFYPFRDETAWIKGIVRPDKRVVGRREVPFAYNRGCFLGKFNC